VAVAVAVIATGWVVIPCVVPWFAVCLRGITPEDAMVRMLIGVIISTGLMPVHILAGASLACLTAPSDFLRGPAGKKWMKALGGTRSILTHRIFCLFGTLPAITLLAALAVLQVCMAPTT
jgi:hypothetical protein